MVFKVIENTSFEFEDIMDDFVEQYNNPDIRIVNIRKNFGLSVNEYIRIRKEAILRGLCVTRKNVNATPRYYQYNSRDDNYIIYKSIKGRKTYFCACKTEDEAKFMVQKYIGNGWDKKDTDKFRMEYRKLQSTK